MTVLEIDMGNTRLKWRLLGSEGERLGGGALAYDGGEGLSVSLLEAVAGDVVVGEVRVAAVAHADRVAGVAAWCRQALKLEPRFACVAQAGDAVEVGYKEPQRLGVDRWLAILAANSVSPQGAVVVDCGSALTVDVVRGGVHEGGYIVPGLRLMVSSLFRDTHAVKVDSSEFVSLELGRSTEQAVNNGLLMMAVSFIREVRCAQGIPHIVMTGGDAEVIAPLLGAGVTVVPELVLDGLMMAQWKCLSSMEQG